MKILIALIFTSTQALTQVTCDPDLKSEQLENLANINQTLLNTTADCSEDENTNSLCTLEEEKLKYNKILAKLVLAKGIDALKHDIEVSYKDIQKISTKKIIEAKKSIDEFEMAITKTEVLTEVLKRNKGKRLLTSSREDIKEKMNTQCTQTASEVCKNIGSLSETNRVELFKFINGYSEAFQVAYEDERDHDSKYREMLKKLSFKHNGKDIPISNFKQTEDYKNIEKIKSRLVTLAKDRTEENAKEIVSLSSTLKDLKANFGNKVSTSDNLVEGVRSHLEDSLSQLSNAYSILTKTDPVKENLKQTKQFIENQSNISLDVLAKDIEDNYNDECSDKTTANCIKHLKNTKPDIASEVINRFDKIIKTDQYATILDSANKCLKSKEIRKEQAECVAKLKQTYPNMFNSNVSELEEQLEKSHRIIKNLSNIPGISDLERQKLVALTILKTNNCFNQKEFELTCNNANISDHATLSLSSDLNSIITQISIQDYKSLSIVEVKKVATSEINDDEIKNKVYEEEGEENSTSKERKTASTSKKKILTTAQKKEQRQKTRLANRDYRTKARSKRREAKFVKNGKTGTGSANFFNGFTNTLAMGVPQMLNYANQRTAIQAQRAANQQYYNYYTTALQNQNNYYNSGLYMNWGSSAYNPYYSNNFNYSNSNLYYNNSNAYQFTYGTNNLGSISSASTYNTGSSSIPTSTNTPFTFSF